MKDETDIITSIIASPIGEAVILVIISQDLQNWHYCFYW